METKDKLKIGGIAFVLLIVGSFSGMGVQELLESDTPIYKCLDEGTVRTCVNGIKADGKRCYYNESNSYKYDHCSDGWIEVDKDKLLEEMYGSEGIPQSNSIAKENCNFEGCNPVR